MRVLAIESSCDESSAAILSGTAEQPLIESHIVLSQIAKTQRYGGVVPEIVARAHLSSLDGVIAKALRDSKHSLTEIDLVAATCGPGLLGGLLVGSMMAKTLALARGLPFMAINHLEGHALSPRLSALTSEQQTSHQESQNAPRQQSSQQSQLAFPYLLLLVSGGHCQLLYVKSVGRYELLGQTRDDSVGECLDKGARLLGLPQASGAAVERAASRGDASRFAKDFTALPLPMYATSGCDFSFSGLKSALARALYGRNLQAQQRYDGAAALQQAVIACLCERSEQAIELLCSRQLSSRSAHPQRRGRNRQTNNQANSQANTLRFAVAGGVSANRALCSALQEVAARRGFSFFSPRREFCTDNAAMIAYAALARSASKHRTPPSAATLPSVATTTQTRTDLDFFVRPRWQLDEKTPVSQWKPHTKAYAKQRVQDIHLTYAHSVKTSKEVKHQ